MESGEPICRNILFVINSLTKAVLTSKLTLVNVTFPPFTKTAPPDCCKHNGDAQPKQLCQYKSHIRPCTMESWEPTHPQFLFGVDSLTVAEFPLKVLPENETVPSLMKMAPPICKHN